MTTTPPDAVAVGVPDPVNPDSKATVGLAGIVNDDGNVTVIVLPDPKAPEALEVNPTVQVVPVAPATKDEPEKVTLPKPVITTLLAAVVAACGALVATEKSLAGYVAAAGLVMPAMLSVAAVLSPRASVPCSVMTTTPPAAVAVGVPDPENPDSKATVGLAGIVNDDGKVTVIVLPVPKAPEALEVNPTVQVAAAPAT
jgi:hypothetical protein